MDDNAETLALAIGARVKQERTHRGWTLDTLAEVADLSRRMIVNVEQGAVNPSIGTLLRLSDALGVGLPALVEPPESKPTKLTRAGKGALLWSGDNGGHGILVAGTQPPDVVELWEWVLNLGEEHISEPHSEGTRELLHVQSGTLTVIVDGETHTLATGDALTFFGDTAHSYANRSDAPVTFSMTVHEPGVGSAHRTELP